MYFSASEINNVARKPRAIVRDELRDMRAQMRRNPHDEPEPTASRFDRMTPAERYYIARELGL